MKKRFLSLVAVLVLAVAAMGVSAQDEGTIVDVAAGNEDFSILVSLVEAAGLVETLADTEAEFTVFAPTNEAFQALPEFVRDYVVNNPDVLTNILTYHVVEGTVTSDMVETGAVPTVAGAEVQAVADDMGVTVDGVSVVMADVSASNGVIHAIDGVLLPPIELAEITPAAVTGDIVTAGSSTVGPLTIAVANAFEEEGYTGNISVDIIGSGGGFARFCEEGSTDISNASRAIREGEVEACANLEEPRSPIEFRVGSDGIAVVVNPENDFATDLTTEQLAAAFTTATTWADIDPNWPDEEIIRYIPGEASGTFGFFGEEVLDDELGEALLAANNVNPNEDDNVLLNGVAGEPNAIGFFGYAYYSQNQDVLQIVSVDGVEPTVSSVESGEYLLARPLFIYSDANIIQEKPQVGEYINYYLTNVNDLIGEVGYFAASDRALRLARVKLLAAQNMMMEDM